MIVVSAMLVAAHLGTAVSAGEPSSDQLGEIASLLQENDVDGLRDYVDAHPDLTEGQGRLARLLREFMEDSTDVGTFHGFPSDLSDSYSQAEQRSATQPSRNEGPGHAAY